MKHATIRRIDLAVESIRQAENFYSSLFKLPVAYREVSVNGQIKKIGSDVTCEDAVRNGMRLMRSILGSTGFEIALSGAPAEFDKRSRIEQVALEADDEELTRLFRAAAELGCQNVSRQNGRLNFKDPYGISWEAVLAR